MAACAKEVVPAQGPLHKEKGLVLHKVSSTAGLRSGYVHKLWWSLCVVLCAACAPSCAPCARPCAQGHGTAQGSTLCAPTRLHKDFCLCACLVRPPGGTRVDLVQGRGVQHKAMHKPTDFGKLPYIYTYMLHPFMGLGVVRLCSAL